MDSILADIAEALGEVRETDGAPWALSWEQVVDAIHEMREERDEWKRRAESAESALRMAIETQTINAVGKRGEV